MSQDTTPFEEVTLPLKQFYADSERLINRCTKPDRVGMSINFSSYYDSIIHLSSIYALQPPFLSHFTYRI